MLSKQRNSLETQIRDCEARLRAHDARLSFSSHLLKEEAKSVASSKAVLLGAAAVGSLAGLLWTRSRRREREALLYGVGDEAYEQHRKRLKKARKLSLPELLQRWGPLLLPLVSPMLNPKLAMTMAKYGVPVAVKPSQALPTVPALDLKQYAGSWYEIARLPTRHEKDCASDVTAEYQADGEGGLVVTNRCRKADGSLQEVTGKARIPDPAHPGQLEVTFAPAALRWFPAVWADYFVLFVDEDYRLALVGTPDRDNLWILGRSPDVPAADLEAVRALALRHGFDTSRLVSLPHGGETPASAGPVLSTVQAGGGAGATAG